MILLNELRHRVNQGFIVEKPHPEFPLSIFNYTPLCQYGKTWDEYTLMARGLILNNETGEVVARPFPKFFNLSEHETNPGKGKPEVYEKLDGSLGILYWWEDQPYFATRGSFNSDQAQWAQGRLKEIPVSCNSEYTHLFEIIYPENRIVVDYGDTKDLIYLGSIHKGTGRFKFENPGNFTQATRYKFKSPEELPTHIDNAEGFVLYYPENNSRVKIKFDEYVRLHKVMTDYSIKKLWEIESSGRSFVGLIQNVPDEFYQQVQNDASYLYDCYLRVEEEAYSYFKRTNSYPDRKEKALFLKKYYPEGMSIVFKMLDDKDPSDLIWKKVKEEYLDG